MKELANFAESVGSLQIHYVAIILGGALAWKIADRKGNDMPRDNRKRLGLISLLLIIGGMALAAFVTVTPFIAKTIEVTP